MDASNEQHEFYENARKRVRQKKRLYFHFVLFVIGSFFLFLLNKVFLVGNDFLQNWYMWAIILWLFFFTLHTVNVFFFSQFMNTDWERKQTEKLILKQELKVAKMEKKMKREEKLKVGNEQYTEELKKNMDSKTRQ